MSLTGQARLAAPPAAPQAHAAAQRRRAERRGAGRTCWRSPGCMSDTESARAAACAAPGRRSRSSSRWLSAFDAELELSGKGGLAGPGFELQARLEQGQLTIEQLSAALWGGRLELQSSFDAGRPLPFMALALDLREIDPTALAAWLDLPPVRRGPGRSLHRGDRRRRQPARPGRQPDRRARASPCATAAWSAASRWPSCARSRPWTAPVAAPRRTLTRPGRHARRRRARR